MRKFAYVTIDDNFTPRSIADNLAVAKANGYEDIFVLHELDAPFGAAQYREKLLAVFRGAYRSRVRVYISDDCKNSAGTGFGQLCAVRDIRQKYLCIKKKSDICEGEEVLAEKGEDCVVIIRGDDASGLDWSNPECAQMIIDSVYMPLLREYEKFVGYEFAGIFSEVPSVDMSGDVPYSKAAVEKFEKVFNKKIDLFDVVMRGEDFEKYESLVAECVKENFVSLLKSFCGENKIEFVASYGNEGVKAGDMTYKMYAKNAHDALCCLKAGVAPVAAIAPGMGSIGKMQSFFEKHADAQIVSVKEFEKADKECYILTDGINGCGVGFLLEGDWCIEDWERDAVYDFDKKGVYNIQEGSFLCIRRKKEGIYTDDLPLRVGGVLTHEVETVKTLEWCEDEGKIKVVLPNEGLGGKYIMFDAECDCLRIKLGYNEYECISKPMLFPLYDFLCGEACTAEIFGGTIKNIYIVKRACL